MSLCHPFAVRSTKADWTDNEMRYDGLASRAEVVDSTGTTRYAWDGIRVLKLEDEEGALKQRQVHGYGPIPKAKQMPVARAMGSV